MVLNIPIPLWKDQACCLTQNDATMQPPMLADVGMYVWKIKETQASEADLPQWGPLLKGVSHGDDDCRVITAVWRRAFDNAAS